MTYHITAYEEWLNHPYFDEDTKAELLSISDNPEEIQDRFYQQLSFGTGGLRALIGAGTNRINKYTVRKATQGLANYLFSEIQDAKLRGVAIAYDSRYKSSEFAQEAAGVLCANKIKTYLFEELRSTPELSFAVGELGCCAGIVITASHNPKEYNGYKVYGEDGGQITPALAEKIMDQIHQIQGYDQILYMERSQALSEGLLQILGEDINSKYIRKVKELVFRKDMLQQEAPKLKVLYTPLHGTGKIPVSRVLKELGFTQLSLVQAQSKPDSSFSTVASPNPEDCQAFELALKEAEALQPHVILATDPDCDRVGVMVKASSDFYQALTGNQVGALLVYYILSSMKEQKALPTNGAIIKTIVTSQLGAKIAQDFGITTVDTLTGFKFIGEKIKEFQATGEKSFLFGYEESYGYLAGSFVRDKDGIIASMLICEMAAYYQAQNKTLLDVLQELYKIYGYYWEGIESITLKGKDGLEKIDLIMDAWRENPPQNIANNRIRWIKDYQLARVYDIVTKQEEKLPLPSSNVLQFILEDHSWFCIRPSGTEPKLKIYFSILGSHQKEAEQRFDSLKSDIMNRIKQYV